MYKTCDNIRKHLHGPSSQTNHHNFSLIQAFITLKQQSSDNITMQKVIAHANVLGPQSLNPDIQQKNYITILSAHIQ